MSQPIASVVKVAASPQQAKIYVAMLQAEGIPAHTDGDSLADEFAMSRRLMNLNGTRVMVPTNSLERAREIIAAVQVEEADLEAQALAAAAPEQPIATPVAAPATASRWPLVLTGAAAITFFGMWLAEVDAKAAARQSFRRYEPIAGGVREVDSRDGTVLRDCFDADRDGMYEHVVTFAKDGQETNSWDKDRNGTWEINADRRRQGLVCEWFDADGDGLWDLGVVRDAAGVERQRLEWVDGTGFRMQAR